MPDLASTFLSFHICISLSPLYVCLRKPIFSYIDFEPGTDKIVDIREKEAISRHANTGAYAFPCGEKLRDVCRAVLDNPVGKAGEFYTSSIIQEMIRVGQKVGLRRRFSVRGGAYRNRNTHFRRDDAETTKNATDRDADVAEFGDQTSTLSLHILFQRARQTRARRNVRAFNRRPHRRPTVTFASVVTITTLVYSRPSGTPLHPCVMPNLRLVTPFSSSSVSTCLVSRAWARRRSYAPSSPWFEKGPSRRGTELGSASTWTA